MVDGCSAPASRSALISHFTKDTIIGDIMDADENTAPYFMEMGMHCLFCPASRGETLEEACAVHGVPVEEMLEKLNKHFAE